MGSHLYIVTSVTQVHDFYVVIMACHGGERVLHCYGCKAIKLVPHCKSFTLIVNHVNYI